MKILITGIEGYIGSVLAPYLMQRGAFGHRTRYRFLS